MQANINFILKTVVVVLIFAAVFYFFFGTGGKYVQANEKLSEIKNSNKENSASINAELEIQGSLK